MLAGILDGGSSARIASRLVRGSEIAAGASAGYRMVSRLDNLFTLSGTPSKGKTVQELEMALRNEVKDLQNNPLQKKNCNALRRKLFLAMCMKKILFFIKQ